jgi:TrmH family RNA methyltransferase
MELITSLQNPRVKNAVKLRDRRQREKQSRIVIDGAREISLAIRSGVRLLDALVCQPLCQTSESQNALAQLARTEAAICHVSPEVFAKVAFGSRAEGLVAIAEAPRIGLAGVRLPAAPLVAVIEGVEKPGNVGAVLRSADGAGVSAVVVADGGTDLYNPNAIRSSLGTIFALPLCAATTGETLAWLREREVQIFAARVDATQIYAQVDFRRGAAIVLGSESAGLSAAWQAGDITPIKLPMLGAADSLNVSAAAAVLFYEALRQRQKAF